jgi:hypothetical protein
MSSKKRKREKKKVSSKIERRKEGTLDLHEAVDELFFVFCGTVGVGLFYTFGAGHLSKVAHPLFLQGGFFGFRGLCGRHRMNIIAKIISVVLKK